MNEICLFGVQLFKMNGIKLKKGQIFFLKLMTSCPLHYTIIFRTDLVTPGRCQINTPIYVHIVQNTKNLE